MKHATLVLATLALLVGSAGQARADFLAGPATIPITGGSVVGGDSDWGIQFTALTDSRLNAFRFNHISSSFTDTIVLKDITSASTTTIVNNVSGLAQPDDISGLSILLKKNDVYQLLASSNIRSNIHDEVHQGKNTAGFPSYPVSDNDISVTSGVYSDLTAGFNGNSEWYAFNNIQTSPEPSSLTLLSIGAGCMAGYCWRRRKPAVA